jgi:hypothetical protein
MKPLHIASLILGLLLVTLLVVYFWPQKPTPRPHVKELEKPHVAPLENEPEVRHPLPPEEPMTSEEKEEAARPLPGLAESDPYMKELLTSLFGQSATEKLLVPQEFIQRMVLIIDALPGKELPHQHLPVRSPPGKFQVAGEEGGKVIAMENFDRYTPYVRLAEAVPAEGLKTAYLKIYPLMEQAYRQLGHPKGYFHDRMIEVLDNLLATPEVNYPLPVVEHIKSYRYADPQLESLSAGQKVLLRMGPENSKRIKEVLRKLRDQLIGERRKEESSSSASNSRVA